MALVVEKVKFLSKYGKIGPLVRVDHSPVENVKTEPIGASKTHLSSNNYGIAFVIQPAAALCD
jgi:hypothetical protein